MTNAKRPASSLEYFPEIGKIKYEGQSTLNPLAFQHYNPTEQILGKPMSAWLKFSVCYWHTFRGTGQDPFGEGTLVRNWDSTTSMEVALDRIKAMFEFLQKLGVEYYTFHDFDICPKGKDLKESHANLDKCVDLLVELQRKTGIKCLWATQNLFSDKIYQSGASTNPDAHVFAYAGAQIKKVLEIAKRLDASNVVFWGGREGLSSYLNTDMKKELDHMAQMFKMAVAYKSKIGATYQFLIEPKPREPMKHQYDYDAMTVIAFLYTYGLQKDFKLNIEPNHTTLAGHEYYHDIEIASKYGFLGSIDANRGDELLGWDTDQFPNNVGNCTMIMKTVIEQGGLGKGGLNFDAKVRRESNELRDMFIAHIGAMDTFALALKKAVKLSESDIPQMVKARYSSYQNGIGLKIHSGTATLEDCEEYVKKNGTPKQTSGEQELYEMLFSRVIHS